MKYQRSDIEDLEDALQQLATTVATAVRCFQDSLVQLKKSRHRDVAVKVPAKSTRADLQNWTSTGAWKGV